MKVISEVMRYHTCLVAAISILGTVYSEEPTDPATQRVLGARYQSGTGGMPQDMGEAIKWYQKAAAQGDARAQLLLAAAYANGEGVVKNDTEAARLMTMAAQQGDAIAQYYLGGMFGLGKGVDKNTKEAFIWYRKAAEGGYTPAYKTVANCYKMGFGVTADPIEAEKWQTKVDSSSTADPITSYSRSKHDADVNALRIPKSSVEPFFATAEKGDADAQLKVGSYYLTEGNDPEGFQWIQKSAAQGNSKACILMGVCFLKGKGVIKNPVMGYSWLLQANALGDEDAKDVKVTIGGLLSSTQIAESQKLCDLRLKNFGSIQKH